MKTKDEVVDKIIEHGSALLAHDRLGTDYLEDHDTVETIKEAIIAFLIHAPNIYESNDSIHGFHYSKYKYALGYFIEQFDTFLKGAPDEEKWSNSIVTAQKILKTAERLLEEIGIFDSLKRGFGRHIVPHSPEAVLGYVWSRESFSNDSDKDSLRDISIHFRRAVEAGSLLTEDDINRIVIEAKRKALTGQSEEQVLNLRNPIWTAFTGPLFSPALHAIALIEHDANLPDFERELFDLIYDKKFRKSLSEDELREEIDKTRKYLSNRILDEGRQITAEGVENSYILRKIGIGPEILPN